MLIKVVVDIAVSGLQINYKAFYGKAIPGHLAKLTIKIASSVTVRLELMHTP